MAREAEIHYLQPADVIALHDVAMRASGYQPSTLVRLGDLSRAVHHQQTLAHYEGAGMAEQAVDLAVEIALAHAWLDGNKRTGMLAMVVFLGLNGILDVPIEEYDAAAEQLLSIVAGDSKTRPGITSQLVDRVASWRTT